MASVAQPKIRSRKDGAARPLDELDKKLLNLMQGKFPLEPRPYASVAQAAGVDESVVLESLTAIRRAGADVVITYHAKDAAAWL